MGMDAIATLGRTAAQAVCMEKRAGPLSAVGGFLEHTIPKFFTRAGHTLPGGLKGARAFSPGRTAATLLGGVGAADALQGASGGWGGTGGTNWHPWNNPKNWLGNIFGHPLRSANEAMGHGQQGPASVTEFGPEQMINGQMVRQGTKQWSPAIQDQAAKYQQMQSELQQQLQHLQLAGYPMPGHPTPGAPAAQPSALAQAPYHPSRYDPPDIDYDVLNRRTGFAR